MAAELDFAALGIREAPRMHLEEEAVVDEQVDSQNNILPSDRRARTPAGCTERDAVVPV